jgi:Tfp pilus assembly protein PilF
MADKEGGDAAELDRLTALLCETRNKLALRPGEHQHVQTILCGLAGRLEQHGRGEEAEVHYRESLALGSVHIGTLVNYACFLDQRDRSEEACSLYQKALAVDPSNPAALGNYAHNLCKAGDYCKAEALLKKAIKRCPSDVTVLHNYGCMLWEGKRDFKRAEEVLEQVIKLDPAHQETVQALSELRAERARAEQEAALHARALLAELDIDAGGEDAAAVLDGAEKKRRRRRKKKGAPGMNDAGEGAGGEEETDALKEMEGPQELWDAHSEAAYRVPESWPAVPRGSAPAVREEDAAGERQRLPAPAHARALAPAAPCATSGGPACFNAGREHGSHQPLQVHSSRAAEEAKDEESERESGSPSGLAPAKSCAHHRLAGAASWRDPDSYNEAGSPASPLTPSEGIWESCEKRSNDSPHEGHWAFQVRHLPGPEAAPAASELGGAGVLEEDAVRYTCPLPRALSHKESWESGLGDAVSWRSPDGDKAASAASRLAVGPAAASAATQAARYQAQFANPPARGPAQLAPQMPPRTPAAMRSWLTIMRSQVEDDGAAQRKQEHAEHEMHIIDDHGIMHVLRVGPAPRSGDADGYRSVCHETYAASSSADSNGLSMTMVSDAAGGKTSRNDMHTEIYTNWRDRRSGGSGSSGTLMGGERGESIQSSVAEAAAAAREREAREKAARIREEAEIFALREDKDQLAASTECCVCLESTRYSPRLFLSILTPCLDSFLVCIAVYHWTNAH